ncbi:hemicentin-1-like [Branchiostoma floridae]|uniref:Hemicentin-1-like n=2 Tax=Branchiostoma floridae TaxID=7739 RepID=A0A9J7M814_BRAFL|nr:hemicentin-1-like [Branchiostoma floridae]
MWSKLFYVVFVTTLALDKGWCQSKIGLTMPESVRAVLGSSATLSATYATSRPIRSVAWFKVDSKVTSKRDPVLAFYPSAGTSPETFGSFRGRARLIGKASLRVAATTLLDDGLYVLVISVSGVAIEEGFVRLNVMVPPTVQVGPTDPYVTRWGKTVSLTCTVRGSRPNITSLYWEKDGTRIDVNVMKYFGGNREMPSLMIRHVTRADAGRYTCIAEHPVRPAAAGLALQVLFPPSIISISDSVMAHLHEQVILQCVADGNPPPNITWFRAGKTLKSSSKTLSQDIRTSSVVLKRAQYNDTGLFSCTVDNGIGDSDTKTVRLSVTRKRIGPLDGATTAIIIGVVVGGLWLLVCIILTVYFVRRRQERVERKKFSFYYDIGRRKPLPPEAGGPKAQDFGPLPEVPLPDKPKKPSAPCAGINTMRRATAHKDKRYAKVLYTFRPREENELHLEADDVIEVLEGEDGGWCLGYLRGRIGLFPSNYVTFLTTREASVFKSEGSSECDEKRSKRNT